MLQCRSLQTEKTFWPNAEKVEKLEIESIKVSKHNVLALMCLDNSSTSQDSGFTYTVKLLSIPSGLFIQNIPNDQDSDMRMPLKWCDNQLFMKVTPKEKLDEDDEIHETLSIFDIGKRHTLAGKFVQFHEIFVMNSSYVILVLMKQKIHGIAQLLIM